MIKCTTLSFICFYCREGTTPQKTTSISFNPPELRGPGHLIEFHVLLSKEDWLWDDTAEVYIRFDDYRLGGFNCCHGPMKIIE